MTNFGFRQYIDLLIEFRGNENIQKDLLEFLIIKAEAAYTTELWNSLPVDTTKIEQKRTFLSLKRSGMGDID